MRVDTVGARNIFYDVAVSRTSQPGHIKELYFGWGARTHWREYIPTSSIIRVDVGDFAIHLGPIPRKMTGRFARVLAYAQVSGIAQCRHFVYRSVRTRAHSSQ